MSKITGNEPAHPIPVVNDTNGYIVTPMACGEYNTSQSGLTIRQHYAGLAMQALIAPGDINYNMSYMDQMTQLAVDFADSLIDNLNKKP